ncbi:MAG: CpXC domain-containing protein [Roseiflexaceae bacterium]
MTSAPPQMAQVACPSCQTPIRVGVINFIDANEQPQLKSILVGGRLNSAQCTACGAPISLAAPLVYHDATKQFCFVHIPQQLMASAKGAEVERFVGSITGMLMQSLPAELPKGYLLSPRKFLTMQTLIEAVLEGDGITKEMMATQRKRIEIISQLLEGMSISDAALLDALQANQADIDDEFKSTLAAFVDASAMSGDQEGMAQLAALQAKVTQFIGGDATIAYELLIEQLRTAPDDDAVRVLMQTNQETIDYTFFDIFNAKILAAQDAEDENTATTLSSLRARILALYEEIQANLEAAYTRAGQILDAVFASEDMTATLTAHLSELDEVFDILLDGQRTMAERAGDDAAVARLTEIIALTAQVKDAALTPDARAVRALLDSDNPTRYIRENIASITGGVVKQLNEISEEYTLKGKTEDADRVRRIAREAGAMLF